MEKTELIDLSRDHLRLSIACTLKIPAADYCNDLRTRTAVNRCLTNVMSLGYNKTIEEAIEEILSFRFFGDEPSATDLETISNELHACDNTFPREIQAYRSLHGKFDAGDSPENILAFIKSMTPITKEYEKLTD